MFTPKLLRTAVPPVRDTGLGGLLRNVVRDAPTLEAYSVARQMPARSSLR